MAAKLPS